MSEDIPFTWYRVSCPKSVRQAPFRIVGFELDPKGNNHDFIQKAIRAAARQGGIPLAPDGSVRNPDQLFKTRYLGALSEILLVRFLQRQLGEEFRVARDDHFSGYENHTDITVKWNDRVVTLEVRGSFPYRPLQRVLCELFDVIGPYATTYKPGEPPRDFYLRTLINTKVDDFSPNRPHRLYFVGGAEAALFGNEGGHTDLKQTGAEYLTIKPIAKARDAAEILGLIRQSLKGEKR